MSERIYEFLTAEKICETVNMEAVCKKNPIANPREYCLRAVCPRNWEPVCDEYGNEYM